MKDFFKMLDEYTQRPNFVPNGDLASSRGAEYMGAMGAILLSEETFYQTNLTFYIRPCHLFEGDD